MRKPPQLAQALLRAAAPQPLGQFITSDLEEEFNMQEPATANIWYWRQVLGSGVPLAGVQFRQSNWEVAALALVLATWGQIFAIDRLWCFVLSQVPLKEDITRGPVYAAICLGIAFFCTLVAGTRCTSRGLIFAAPACLCLTILGLIASCGVTPKWFDLAMPLCTMA